MTRRVTTLKTNISPEKSLFEDYFPFGMVPFQVRIVSFSNYPDKVARWNVHQFIAVIPFAARFSAQKSV